MKNHMNENTVTALLVVGVIGLMACGLFAMLAAFDAGMVMQ